MYTFPLRVLRQTCIKLGIHFKQRQTKAQRSSLSSASVDSAPSQATCIRLPWFEPSCIGRSKWGKPEEFPPYTQYSRNMPRLVETEKHSSVCGAACRGCHALACLCPKCISGLRVRLISVKKKQYTTVNNNNNADNETCHTQLIKHLSNWSCNLMISHSPFYTEMRRTLIHVCLTFWSMLAVYICKYVII